MSANLSKSNIIQALTHAVHPEIRNHNLVELGMIPEVNVEEGRIDVKLALPSLEIPIRQQLIDAVHQALSGVTAGSAVKVDVMEMEPAQKAAYKSMVKQSFQIAAKPGVHIHKVLAVMSGKGGVGKSTVASLLATALERRGFWVGILDADITGPSIPKLFGSHQPLEGGPEGIQPVVSGQGIKLMSINLLLPDEDQPVVWRGPLISRAIQQFWSEIAWGDLDVLVVDLPPGTSDASLTVMQSLPLDGIILVTSPQDLAGMVVRKAANMAIEIGAHLVGLVENMSYILCPQCGEKIDVFGTSHAKQTAQWIGIPLLGHLPLDPQLSTFCDEGTVELYHSVAFDLITDQVIELAQLRELEPSL